MIKRDFDNVSIRGRVAFGIMCFERYVTVKYSKQDFTPACRLAWDIISDKDYIDVSADRYMEIIPEYLYEFDSYEDAEFDFLTLEEFFTMRELIPFDDQSLETIMHCIYDIAMVHAYGAIQAPARESIDYVFEIIAVLKKEHILLPNLSSVKQFSFDESGGWGAPISHEGISIVLGRCS